MGRSSATFRAGCTVAALASLGVGAAFYLTDRTAGAPGDQFPSFAHTAAVGFALVVISARRRAALVMAAALGLALEVGQASRLPAVGLGTFDVWDVVAVLVAAMSVAIVTAGLPARAHGFDTQPSCGSTPVHRRSLRHPVSAAVVALVAVATSTATGHEPDPDAGELPVVPVDLTFDPENVEIPAGATGTVTITASVPNATRLQIQLDRPPTLFTPDTDLCVSDDDVRVLTCDFDFTMAPREGVGRIDVIASGNSSSVDLITRTELLITSVAPPTTTAPTAEDQTATELDVPEPEVTCTPGPAPVGAASGDAGTGFDVADVRVDGSGGWSSAGGTTSLDLLGQGGVTVGHVHPELVWTPCQDGEIGSIRVDVSGSATSANDTGAVAVRALVEQGDNVFVSTDALSIREADGSSSSSWVVDADTLTQLAGTEPIDLVAGPTLRVGYTAAITCPTGSICAAIERTFTLDGFSSEISSG